MTTPASLSTDRPVRLLIPKRAEARSSRASFTSNSLLLRLATAALALLLTGPAFAQPLGFAVNRYEPAERGSDWFWGESLDLRGHERLAVGAVFDYAADPLLLASRGSTDLVGVVEPQVNLHLGASLVLAQRLRLSLSAPILMLQRSAFIDAPADGARIQAVTGSGLGDLRVSADVRLLGQYRDKLTLALGAQLFLPSGKQEAFISDGALRVLPRLALAGDASGVAYAAQVGMLFRTGNVHLGDVQLGHELRLGGSLGARLFGDAWLFGPELWATTDALGGEGFLTERSTHVEALMGAHYTSRSGLRAGLGVAQGLSGGLGTPSRRLVAYLQGFLPDATPTAAAAPERHAPARLGPSDDDATPPEALDSDSDRTPEAAAQETGPVTGRVSTESGSDRDGTGDASNSCPKPAGKKHQGSGHNGCPLAFIGEQQIITGERIEFRPRSAALRLESIPVLEQVLRLLQEHPEVLRVRVEGHTDSRGSRRRNDRLSLKRAVAVVDWLVERGIDRARLQSAGLGPRRPIDTNRTAAGRSKNRRVEFHIHQRARSPAPD